MSKVKLKKYLATLTKKQVIEVVLEMYNAHKEAKARAYYHGVVLRDRRKELNMTQRELAEKVGTARSYIARVEHGETDMQLSSLLRIADALHMSFALVFA